MGDQAMPPPQMTPGAWDECQSAETEPSFERYELSAATKENGRKRTVEGERLKENGHYCTEHVAWDVPLLFDDTSCLVALTL